MFRKARSVGSSAVFVWKPFKKISIPEKTKTKEIIPGVLHNQLVFWEDSAYAWGIVSVVVIHRWCENHNNLRNSKIMLAPHWGILDSWFFRSVPRFS